MGVGIFTFQYAYTLCGLVWGTLLGSIVLLCVVMGMSYLLKVCDYIEQDENDRLDKEATHSNLSFNTSEKSEDFKEPIKTGKYELPVSKKFSNLNGNKDEIIDIDTQKKAKFQIITFHQITEKVVGPMRMPLTVLSIFANAGMSTGFALGNYVYLIKSVIELTGFSVLVSSTFICLFMMLLLKLIVEPEKIKPVAYVLTVFIVGSASTIMVFNYSDYLTNYGAKPDNYELVNLKHSGLLIGVALFSFESISVLINSKIQYSDF